MNSEKVIPDYSEIRKATQEKVKFPIAVSLDKEAYQAEVDRLQAMCQTLNDFVSTYKQDFKYQPNTYESFKNLLLPIVVKMPDEKVLIKQLKGRWLAEHEIHLQLSKGIKLNRDKELGFLLEAYDFPDALNANLNHIFNLLRRCFIPDGLKFSDLYSEEKKSFELSDELKTDLKKKHSIFAHTQKELDLISLRHQLADALNAMAIEHNVGLHYIPPFFQQILSYAGRAHPDRPSPCIWSVPKRSMEAALPQIELVPDSIDDPNKYDGHGDIIGHFEPIKVKAKIDGVPHELAVTTHAVQLAGGQVLNAREIAQDPAILAQLMQSEASIERHRDIA
jgi:hypothetical protein